MSADGKAVMAMIEEVRRQFKNIPSLTKALDIMKKNHWKEQSERSQEDVKNFRRSRWCS